MNLQLLCLVLQSKIWFFVHKHELLTLLFWFVKYQLSFFLNTRESDNGIKKPELSRNPRYHDIRMDEVYPAKKCRSRMLFGKENVKVHILTYIIYLFSCNVFFFFLSLVSIQSVFYKTTLLFSPGKYFNGPTYQP